MPAEDQPERVLILTLGLPRSGKSTWARQQGVPIVNPDSIRLAMHGKRFERLAEPYVWATAKVMVRALFLAGHPRVIVDSTNIKGRRSWYTDVIPWKTVLYIVDTPKEVCIERAIATDQEDLIPVIERFSEEFEPPRITEFYDGFPVETFDDS